MMFSLLPNDYIDPVFISIIFHIYYTLLKNCLWLYCWFGLSPLFRILVIGFVIWGGEQRRWGSPSYSSCWRSSTSRKTKSDNVIHRIFYEPFFYERFCLHDFETEGKNEWSKKVKDEFTGIVSWTLLLLNFFKETKIKSKQLVIQEMFTSVTQTIFSYQPSQRLLHQS